MIRIAPIILCIPFYLAAQPAATKTNTAKIYTQALTDFIKDANTRNKTHFDTLFIGQRKNGQPDDFPEITLPENIEGTRIILITPDAAALKQKERKNRIYINMIGWVDKQKAEFALFVFSNGFEHQYNYSILYTYNSSQKSFTLTKLQFKGPPFDK